MAPSPVVTMVYVPPRRGEAHLPGYNFCGPGTDVDRRLAEGVQPVNALDQACLIHDLATESRGPQSARTPEARREADRILRDAAIDVAKTTTDEAMRAAAIAVAASMAANLVRSSRGGVIPV